MVISIEPIIVGLIVVDVAATLTGNFVLWQIVMRQGERLSNLEGQHDRCPRVVHPE